MKKMNVLLASILATGLMVNATNAMAKPNGKLGEDVQRQMIMVKAEQAGDVVVKVGKDGSRNSYEFTYAELSDTSAISEKLSDLDADLSAEVLDILTQIQQQDSAVVVTKDANITVDGNTTEMTMVRTVDGDTMHIEIDVQGEAVLSGKRHFISKLLGKGKKGQGAHNGKRKHKMMGNGNGMKKNRKDAAKFITKMIEKSKLTDEQISQIRAALDSK